MPSHYSPNELQRIYLEAREAIIRSFHRWTIALQDEGEHNLARRTEALLNRYGQDPDAVTDQEIAALWSEISGWFNDWLNARKP